jgi:hypothetical protein
MKYLFAIIGDETQYAELSPEEGAENMKAWDAYTSEANEAGVLLGGEGLQPSATATTLRLQGGDHVITDGPFAETKEQLGGYYLLDCKDLDDAIAWGKKLPISEGSSVEIRPVMDYEAAGSTQHEHSSAEAQAS